MPAPVLPEEITIQETLLTAIQLHSAGAVTLTMPKPPLDGTLALAAPSVMVQPTPAWLMLKVRPPIVREPNRVAPLGFAVTKYARVPFPVPLAPAVMLSQSLLLTAVQAQLLVMASVPAPPDTGGNGEVGVTVTLHAPLPCLTMKTWLPTITVPLRG